MNFDYYLLILPFISAFIGYLTNWVAVKMLFHPKEPINLLGFKIQGVFPKRQNALAENLGEVISQELISNDELLNKIDTDKIAEELPDLLDKKIEIFLKDKLGEQFPMLKMFLNADLIEKVKNIILQELSKAVVPAVDKIKTHLSANLDIKSMIVEKVNAFPHEKLEEILFRIMKKEFKTIELLGGLLGFFIGWIQILLIVLPRML